MQHILINKELIQRDWKENTFLKDRNVKFIGKKKRQLKRHKKGIAK